VAPDQLIEFRVGVNVGDIIIDGEDIFGDGVNVAARLETLAPAGGICISGNVHEQIAGKLEYGFADLGTREVKNIARPVRVFAWNGGVSSVLSVTANGAGPALTLPGGPSLAVPSFQNMSGAPSIAVLPFVNRSHDPEDEYFSDGLADELLNVLTKVRGLRVAARSSAFTFKGKGVTVAEVDRALNVATVLEGSVRKAANRIRISVQLVKVADGYDLWSESYDRTLEDIFAVQAAGTPRRVSSISSRHWTGIRDSRSPGPS
jgi:adenylate cyclase